MSYAPILSVTDVRVTLQYGSELHCSPFTVRTWFVLFVTRACALNITATKHIRTFGVSLAKCSSSRGGRLQSILPHKRTTQYFRKHRFGAHFDDACEARSRTTHKTCPLGQRGIHLLSPNLSPTQRPPLTVSFIQARGTFDVFPDFSSGA